MSESINWIHFSDLHFGLDRESWLWPKVKHDLFGDIEKLAGEIGGWDVVFFTGDFTQTGAKAEFDGIDAELEDLWRVLGKSGTTPKLCAVPGNHDLVRPHSHSSIARTLTQLWWTDESLRQQFWRDQQCEYRVAVTEFFGNFVDWSSKLPVPVLEMVPGILPGDWSSPIHPVKTRWTTRELPPQPEAAGAR